MFTKCNKMLAVLLSAALSVTVFGSDFASAKVWAADEEITESVQSEETNSETDNGGDASESYVEEQASEDTYVVEESTPQESEYTEEVQYTEETATEVTENTEITENAENAENVEGAENLDAEGLEGEKLEGEELEDKELTEEELAAKALKEAEEKALKEAEEKAKVAEEYPAVVFNDSVAGMNVSVDAPEGTFPKGTSMRLSAISDSQAVSAANDAIDGEVKEAKGVDISFANAEGNEIEPNGAVNVSISLASALEGESFSVVHLDDNGNSEMVAGASNSGASFTADAFSIYIVAGSGDSTSDTDEVKAYATYEFIYNGEVFNSQVVKKGDLLQSPGNPVKDECTVFLGWFLLLNGEKVPVFFDENIKPVDMTTICCVNAGETYRLYAATSKVDYEIKDNGAFYFATNTVYNNEDFKIEISSKGCVNGEYSIDLFINGERVVVNPECCEYIRNHVELICQGAQITCAFIEYLISISEEKEVVIENTTITYHSNDERDLSYTLGAAVSGRRLMLLRAVSNASSGLKVNEAVKAFDIENENFNWTREGYTFLGWSEVAGDNANAVFVDPGMEIAADNSNPESGNHLYAVWGKAESTEDEPVIEDPTNEDPTTEEPATEDPTNNDPSDPVPSTPATPSDPTPSNPETPSTTETTTTVETPAEDPVEAPVAEAPVEDAAAVLGEKRTEDLPEVLGARRAATEDGTNIAGRVVAILIALLAASGLIVIGKKKEEE